VRSEEARASARSQTCVALSGDDRGWFLIGASPDLRSQVESFPALGVRGSVRGSALEGVLLAGADLDHVLGLFLLREGGRLCVHATPAVRRSLSEGLMIDSVLGRYCGLEWREPPGRLGPLLCRDGRPSGLHYEVFSAPGKPPRYREGCAPPDPGDCSGYRIVDPQTGGHLVVLPGTAALDDDLLRRLNDGNVLLIDGTFWSEHELRESGAGGPSASEMGHLPIGGPGGSLKRLAALSVRQTIYIHINNTNPVLLDDSPERREVDAAGFEVGRDGTEFTV
jgi:pyrroloquinoline quinone biosynthesis protein B